MSASPIRLWPFVAALCALAPAQEFPVAWVGARLIPVDGPEIEDGVFAIHKGKILAAGPRADTPVAAGTVIKNGQGLVIMPGLICTHSHVGGGSGGDQSDAIQPDVRILDSINVRDAGFQKARAGGLTLLNVMPGSGHLCSGQTIALKLRQGRVIDDLLYLDAEGRPVSGIKMANGTNPMGRSGFPGTRSKSAALMRARLEKAMEYRREREAGETKSKARDLGLEALSEALAGRRVVHHHTHRHDDILTVLRIAREYGHRVVLHHVSDAWMVAGEIAASGAACSIIMLDSPGGKLEAKDIDWKSAAALEKAGVTTAFHTDDPITDSRLFLRSAAFGVRAGMSRAKALEGVTLAGARILEVDDRTGSLTPGKDADFAILNGDPLSIYTRVIETWVEGERVFDLSLETDRLYAEGGYGASTPQAFYLCCFDVWEAR